jgi:hypothetical protein
MLLLDNGNITRKDMTAGDVWKKFTVIFNEEYDSYKCFHSDFANTIK